jgi:hypothetical protein
MAKSEQKYVIVRSHTAGVHSGYLVSRKGDTVVLASSRRLWRWYGASLSEVANHGPAKGDNRFGGEVINTEIVSPQGFEIIECRPNAVQGIKAVPEWRA